MDDNKFLDMLADMLIAPDTVIRKEWVQRLMRMLEERDGNMLDDGFGNSWSKTCPMCHMQTMQIVRPGKVQCSICG